MQIAQATARKSLIPATPRGGPRFRRAGVYRQESHSEGSGNGFTGAILITLVIVGLIFAIAARRDAPTEPPIGVTGFAQHRAARIVIPTDDGYQCREHAFYNDSGLMGPERVVVCDENLPRGARAASSGGGSFDSFKQAFGRK
jgi:hypothetical protein